MHAEVKPPHWYLRMKYHLFYPIYYRQNKEVWQLESRYKSNSGHAVLVLSSTTQPNSVRMKRSISLDENSQQWSDFGAEKFIKKSALMYFFLIPRAENVAKDPEIKPEWAQVKRTSNLWLTLNNCPQLYTEALRGRQKLFLGWSIF